jgi:hypothetical protein
LTNHCCIFEHIFLTFLRFVLFYQYLTFPQAMLYAFDILI